MAWCNFLDDFSKFQAVVRLQKLILARPLLESLQSLSWLKMTFIPVLGLQFCNLEKLAFFGILR
ncbi:MAG: hypothetical protein EAZ98_23700 [Oscillatoriales cyanobacterium]|nr:MAG: hypothetical protein EA000_25960 [Oscillatoriales cyanobacterium]TAD93201.1 MAG: hypothetical protein EAZ98_23700 [Oscillatoriales cyanobacterium]TAF36273.1 MAG: hypothetical protein EAZ68_17015 [Oscillatoriales cyanobacterium]TAF61819.1 MAG: hypothetical protein EAZ59_24980 [Oscillatoriales cyanobacterium]